MHSSYVTLELIFGGRRIPLSQLAIGFAIVAEPIDLPAGEGEILMTVDGNLERMPVFLPDGCRPLETRFTIEATRTQVK